MHRGHRLAAMPTMLFSGQLRLFQSMR